MKIIQSSILILLFLFVACKKEGSNKNEKAIEITSKTQNTSSDIYDISVKKVTYDELKPYLTKNNDSIYVVNFWATWCKPCVKELPYFEKLKIAYEPQKVKLLLVSLDFPNQVETRLKPFIKKKNLKSEIVLLDDINEDEWIKAISPDWSGAIPATIIYNKNKRSFYEQSFDYKTLETELQTFLN